MQPKPRYGHSSSSNNDMKKSIWFFIGFLFSALSFFAFNAVSAISIRKTEVGAHTEYKAAITQLRLWQTEWKTLTVAEKDDVLLELIGLIEARYIVERPLEFLTDIRP